MNPITNSYQDEDDSNDDLLITRMIKTMAWYKEEIAMKGELKPVHPLWVPGDSGWGNGFIDLLSDSLFFKEQLEYWH